MCHQLLQAKMSPHLLWLFLSIGCPGSALPHELHQTHPDVLWGFVLSYLTSERQCSFFYKGEVGSSRDGACVVQFPLKCSATTSASSTTILFTSAKLISCDVFTIHNHFIIESPFKMSYKKDYWTNWSIFKSHGDPIPIVPLPLSDS